MERIRNWMKISTKAIPAASDRVFRSNQAFRQVELSDTPALAALMDRAYTGTIDHEGETPEQCLEEMKGTLTGKYGPFLDFASFALFDENRDGEKRAISASIVTFWKEKPLLAFSMTDPSEKGRGHAGFLIERSISALAERGHPVLYLVVTEGNTSAETLYRRMGFEFVGPALPKEPPSVS